jgi:putative DNA methylase
VSDEELKAAELGTVRADGRGKDAYMVHVVDGQEYRTKISVLRGDYRKPDGTTGNRLRLWEKEDFKPRPDDIFQERLYCVQWMRPKPSGRGYEYEFRAVTAADLERERVVEEYVAAHLAEWQAQGWVPDMRIEPGEETARLYRERGWTHWHHLFNPRQLLIFGLMQ